MFFSRLKRLLGIGGKGSSGDPQFISENDPNQLNFEIASVNEPQRPAPSGKRKKRPTVKLIVDRSKPGQMSAPTFLVGGKTIQSPTRHEEEDIPTRETVLVRRRGTGGTRLIRRKKRVSLERSLIALSALFFVGFAVAIVLVSRDSLPSGQGSVEPVTSGPESGGQAAKAEAPVENTHTKFYYGPFTVRSCSAWCFSLKGTSRTTCERGCQKMGFVDYPRRVAITDADPKFDAQRIIADCKARDSRDSYYDSQETWEAETRGALHLLGSTPPLSNPIAREEIFDRFRAFNKLNAALKLPPEGSDLQKSVTKLLAQASCLRLQTYLAECGIAECALDGDAWSEQFYRSLSELLAPETVGVESELQSKTKALNLDSAVVEGGVAQ